MKTFKDSLKSSFKLILQSMGIVSTCIIPLIGIVWYFDRFNKDWLTILIGIVFGIIWMVLFVAISDYFYYKD